MNRRYKLFSLRKMAYHKPESLGYTTDPDQAGIFSEAYAIGFCLDSVNESDRNLPGNAMVPVEEKE